MFFTRSNGLHTTWSEEKPGEVSVRDAHDNEQLAMTLAVAEELSEDLARKAEYGRRFNRAETSIRQVYPPVIYPSIHYSMPASKTNPIDFKWFMVGSLIVIPLWLIFLLLAFRAQ